MNIVSDLIPYPVAIGLWLALGLGVLWHVRNCPWYMLRDRDNLNVFLGAAVAVLALWLIRTGIKPGLNFHLVGATALTLMFRPTHALFALALVTAATTLWDGEYKAYPANVLIMGVVPVLVSWSIYRLVDRRLPNHMFVYIFLNAFFGAAAAVFTVGLASTALMAMIGAYTLDYLMREYLPYYLLMAWSEAFATGMVMTLLVVYRPQWVATFDDRRYL